MNNKSLQKITFLFIFFITFPCAGTETAVDISGTWSLNEQLSENFQEKIKEAMKSARSGRGRPDGVSGASGKGGNREGGGRGRPAGAEGSSRGGGNRREEMQRELENLSLFADKFQISQNEPEIIISFLDKEQRTIHTDGRGITVTASGYTSNPMGPYIAGWNNEKQLVIETTNSSGIKIEERFTLSPDRQQLHTRVSIELPKLDKPVEIVRVYDLVE